jgi:hypothetical protein
LDRRGVFIEIEIGIAIEIGANGESFGNDPDPDSDGLNIVIRCTDAIWGWPGCF